MKFASFSASRAKVRAAKRSAEKASGWWVQFGDVIFAYAANDKWADVTDALGSRTTSQPEGVVRKGNMHLVIQKGRTFQQAYPDVPVLLDKGRYLVVDIPAGQARKMGHEDEVCFEIRPLAENSVVFEARERSAVKRATQPVIDAVAALDEARYAQRLTDLTNHRTRLSSSAEYADATEWARTQFENMGYDTEVVEVPFSGVVSANVIAHKPGNGSDRKEYLVVGHLDSVNHEDGPSAPAPGADDNASGSAGVLELAEVFSGRSIAHDLTFILFGGEEQGLHGSIQYVAGLNQAARDRIGGVLNMDMIGSVNATPPSVLLEGASVSAAQIDALSDAAGEFADLDVQSTLNYFGSDHKPFLDNGIPAVLTIEGADGANDDIHTGRDTLDKVDTTFAIEILKMNAGYLAAALEVAETAEEGAEDHDCGCGCAGVQGGNDQTRQIQELGLHYSALMAQYSRLGPQGLLQQEDIAAWQHLRYAHDSLMQGLRSRP